MQASPEFAIFCQQFIQDIHLIASTEEEAIEWALSPLDREARTRLRDFIGMIIDKDFPDDELQRLWHSTPADIYFRDTRDLRKMLMSTLKKINA